MKKVLIGYCFILFCQSSQAQTWEWAKSIQGSANDYNWDIAVDMFGNSYINGSFQNSIFFGNNVWLYSAPGEWAGYIAKYDNASNIVWANKISGKGIFGNFSPNGITIDNNQNCYLTGEFYDSLSLGSLFLTTPSFIDSCYSQWDTFPCTQYYSGIYIAKILPSGSPAWLSLTGLSLPGNTHLQFNRNR